MVCQQPRRHRQAAEVASDEPERAFGPGLVQGDRLQPPHAAHQREGPVGEQPDAEAVVDHAAHGVQARHLDALAQGAPGARRAAPHGEADAAVGLQADDVPVEHVLEPDRGPSRQRMPLGHHEHQPVAAVGAALQLLRFGAVAGMAQAHVGRAFAHGMQDVGAQVLLQVDLDLGMLPGEGPEVLGQELHDGGNVRVYPHVAAHAVGVFAQFALHALQPEKHGARMVQQAFARRRQRHAPAVPVQQRGAHGRFEVRQALADRGRRDEFALRGPTDAAQLADGHEQLQRRQVDAAREMAVGAFHGAGRPASSKEKPCRDCPLDGGVQSSRNATSHIAMADAGA